MADGKYLPGGPREGDEGGKRLREGRGGGRGGGQIPGQNFLKKEGTALLLDGRERWQEAAPLAVAEAGKGELGGKLLGSVKDLGKAERRAFRVLWSSSHGTCLGQAGEGKVLI